LTIATIFLAGNFAAVFPLAGNFNVTVASISLVLKKKKDIHKFGHESQLAHLAILAATAFVAGQILDKWLFTMESIQLTNVHSFVYYQFNGHS
jgi:hypothetical protein